MINFSLEKFRSSDATETFRVKNSDNVLTKSRKLETKSSWIIKFKSFFKFEKAKELISISPYYLYTDLAALVSCNYDMCSQLVLRDSRSVGAPNGRGPRFLEPAEPAIATPLSERLKHNYLTPNLAIAFISNKGYLPTFTRVGIYLKNGFLLWDFFHGKYSYCWL